MEASEVIRRIATLALTTVVLSMAFAATASAQVSPPTSEVLPSTTASGVGSGNLVRTGTDIMPSVLLALALTAAGVLLVVVARRRTRGHAIA
jgi:hypothetical protein